MSSSSFFSKIYKTFSDWWNEKAEKWLKTGELSAYSVRITRYMEKHPKASLAEARGHKKEIIKITKKRMRMTVGTAIYPVGKSKTKRYTLSEVVDADLVEETKDKLLEEMYRKIERDVGYNRNDWWFEVSTGFEVIEVEGD